MSSPNEAPASLRPAPLRFRRHLSFGPLPANRMAAGRALFFLSGAALLSACAGHAPPMTATQEAATYLAKAKPSYAPPGPPDDPWGPYITEASNKFDVPERWVREVMRVESGAHEFRANGELITSPVGAMGLMQLMPETYDEVRARYSLGDDAYDPHNNILAGTAYLREMYDAFGSPGFLAAYNGGPARLEDYLTHNRPLPTETRRYVAMIGPAIQGIWPQARSPAEQYAVNQIPIDIPAGPRYVVRHANYAIASRGRRGHEVLTRFASANGRRGVGHVPASAQMPVEVAEVPESQMNRLQFSPMRGAGAQPGPSHASVRLASAHTLVSSQTRVAYSLPSHHGIHIIDSAMASESVGHGVGGKSWAVQIGAYGNAGQAAQAAGSARGRVGGAQAVTPVRQGHGTVYRARLSGMTHEGAVAACQKLVHGHGSCMVVAPSAL